jgi:TnpA family transposase
MPRRCAVAREQLVELLALPVAEPELIRHWTLDAADLAAIERRRGDPNQLGFALQLCTFRYPGRLLRPREVIPEAVLAFVAGQLRVAPHALADYAARRQTRRDQLRALRTAFGSSTARPIIAKSSKPATRAGASNTARECHPGLPRWAKQAPPARAAPS